jgi:hypothetical protein
MSVFHQPCNLTVLAVGGDVTFRIAGDKTFEMRLFAHQRRDYIVVRGGFTSGLRARGRFRSVQDNGRCHDIVRGTWMAERVETAA